MAPNLNTTQSPDETAFIPFGYLPDFTIGFHPEIQIYVACLAAYNGGSLHGKWIDATLGEDHIYTHVKAMLKSSPEHDAEEWAIHDHSGFEGAPISEWDSFSDVAAFAQFVEEHGELGGELLSHFGGDLEDAKKAMDEYQGEHISLAMFAQQLTEDCGTEIPDHLSFYIDYADMGRDMEMTGDIFTIEIAYDEIHVFWAH